MASQDPIIQSIDSYVVSALDDQRIKDITAIVRPLETVPAFANVTIWNPNGKWMSGRLPKPPEYGSVPSCYRLAYSLLRQLGRDLTQIDDIESGVPQIAFPGNKKVIPDEVVISGKKVDEIALEVNKDKTPEQSGLGPRMYGLRVFKMSGAEVTDLISTLRYVTDSYLPKSFFASLYWSFSEPEWLKYCSIFRTVPLGSLGDATHPTVSDLTKALSSRLKELKAKETDAALDPDEKDEIQQDLEKYKTNHDYLSSDKRKEMDMRRRAMTENIRKSVPQMQDKCGFNPLRVDELLEQTLKLSLTELSSHVVQCIKGYMFVEGKGDSWNQITEKSAHPVTFVSAAGIDFCTPTTTVIEGLKYFNDMGEEMLMNQRFKGFNPDGERALYDRVKGLYRLIYRAFQVQECKNPILLPLGLGVFLSNVDPDIKNKVVELYFAAQFDLLCENDYGFETVWLNGARYTKNAKDMVLSRRFKFKCNFVVHGKDAKFLAVELAKIKKAPGLLNPSDVVAVMQGQVGYYWEKGRQDRYVGEEDLTATSSLILQHSSISNEIDLDLIVDDEDMPGTPQQWCAVKPPLNYEYFEKKYNVEK